MDNSLYGLSEFLYSTLPAMGADFVGFLGQLLLAVILFIVFWTIGVSLEKLLSEGVKALKVDSLLSKIGMNRVLEKAGTKLNTGSFLGALVKWFLIIAGLLVASNVLGLIQVSSFLESILLYIPNIIVAAIILIAGVILADFVAKVVASSISAAGLKSAPFVSSIAKWAIFIFAFIAALDQLQIAQTFINTLYIGLVAMISIAGGLAFGLGGKEHASELITKLKKDISEKE
jgi:hypothetical protein